MSSMDFCMLISDKPTDIEAPLARFNFIRVIGIVNTERYKL